MNKLGVLCESRGGAENVEEVPDLETVVKFAATVVEDASQAMVIYV